MKREKSLLDWATERLQFFRRAQKLGFLTKKEFALLLLNALLKRPARGKSHLAYSAKADRLRGQYLKDGTFVFKEARLPLLDAEDESLFFGWVFDDIYHVYLEHDDDYREEAMLDFYDSLPEGTYCLKNDVVDVRIEPGDVVFDVGSWVGDFAAYASVKKAIVYAFEPGSKLYNHTLLKTAELNGNIYPVKMGLGDVPATVNIDETASNSLSLKIDSQQSGRADSTIEITTIDDFVRDNKLDRVDFIKADIEGHERYMLMGARETLKRFAPKLAICTYHLPDDPEVLASLIKEANPAYRIVQKRKKLYASVTKA